MIERRFVSLVASLAGAALLLVPLAGRAASPAAPTPQAPAASGTPAAGDVIAVGWRPGVARVAANRTLLGAGAIPLAGIPQIAVDLVRAPAGVPTATIIARLAGAPGVEFAEPGARMSLDWEPNDPYRRDQYMLDHVRAPRAWDVWPRKGSRKSGVTVAVVDTGVDPYHADLRGRLTGGRRFYTGECTAADWMEQLARDPAAYVNYFALCTDGEYRDADGHGTAVASVIAARTNNRYGIASIAYNSRVLPIRCDHARGGLDGIACAAGIVDAVDRGARVVNMSFGTTEAVSPLLRAVLYAEAKGVVTVAARGNGASSRGQYPACYPTVIGVSATDRRMRLAGFSSYGGGDSCTFVAAPGHKVLAASLGWFSEASGTSLASPIAAGVVALALGKQPSLSPLDVRRRLRACSRDLGAAGYDARFGHGLVDAYRLLICRA